MQTGTVFKMGKHRPLLLFSFFSNTNFIEKTVGFSRIQTWIVGAEGEHADHSTTTTALVFNMFILPRYLDQIDYFNDKTKSSTNLGVPP